MIVHFEKVGRDDENSNPVSDAVQGSEKRHHAEKMAERDGAEIYLFRAVEENGLGRVV